MSDSSNSEEEAIDMMSTLPDSLFNEILSLLPTKAAVATCMLSPSGRRHFWQHLDVLDFSDNDFIYCPRRHNHHLDDDTVLHQLSLQWNSLERRIVAFVNAVLSLRKTRDVRKFRFSCIYSYGSAFYDNSLEPLILAAVGPHLQEFQLSLAPHSFTLFFLPVCVFSCTSLVSLSLVGAIILPTPSSVHLPSLKTLEVHVFNMQPKSIYTILSGCHVLENLYLAFTSSVIDVPMIVVPSSVKRFTFVDRTLSEIDHLEIDTPSLQYLNITITNLCLKYSFTSLENVVEAHLDIYPTDWHISLVLKLLLALHKTKFLALGSSTIQCLFYDPAIDFPKFGYLLRLELVLSNLNFNLLLDILQKCPMLQVLTIEKDKEYKSSFLKSWTPPTTTVPNCLVSNLTMIIFRGYQGSPEEEAFTAYILLIRGLVLKTLTIHTDSSLDLEEKHRIFEQLSDIPKASNTCQLIFP